MAKVSKLIVVYTTWDPISKYVRRVCREVAKEEGIELDEREEDWEFLAKYGEKDEIAGVDIPQVLLQYDNGKIVHVMTRIPITDKGKPDIDKAKNIIKNAIKGEA